MEEEIIIEREYIEAAKAQMATDPKLRPCQLCFHFDSNKKWCRFYQQPKQTYNYGASCFLTNEQALLALLIQERKRSIQRKAILLRKMDVMEAMINGADLVRDDIQEMIKKDYERLDIKAKTDDETYKKSMKNLTRLQKAYAKMKKSLQDIESEYKNYCEYWHQYMFADEFGCYNQEYDKYKSNAGFLTYSFFVMDDAFFESDENVNTFVNFLNGLPRKRKSPMEQEYLKRYLIKI